MFAIITTAPQLIFASCRPRSARQVQRDAGGAPMALLRTIQATARSTALTILLTGYCNLKYDTRDGLRVEYGALMLQPVPLLIPQ
jgi:hypothetical protein